MPDKDGQLYLRYLRSRDREALKTLFVKYRDSLLYYLYGIVKNMDDAQELMMDTFADLASGTVNYRIKKDASFKSWLFAVAHNKARMFLRKNKVAVVSDDELELADLYSKNDMKQPEKSIVINETNSYIYKALDSLNENYRQIFFLLYFEQMKPPEVARIMGISIKKVYNLTARAKEALQQTLDRMGYSWDI
ncbi:MAG: RNA polymerase sigma factor [Lachnospiraceae bacterium]|nr:RNA polymerase sigma factor [Lachnospiraceae bacterium]